MTIVIEHHSDMRTNPSKEGRYYVNHSASKGLAKRIKEDEASWRETPMFENSFSSS